MEKIIITKKEVNTIIKNFKEAHWEGILEEDGYLLVEKFFKKWPEFKNKYIWISDPFNFKKCQTK